MVLNYVQTDAYIIQIHLDSFYSNYDFMVPPKTEAFTAMHVTMSTFVGPKLECVQIPLYSEYRLSSCPAEVFEMYTEAWDIFMNACKFCKVSPVSDGTCIRTALGLPYIGAA